MDKFVSTFEEACARLNKGTELPDVSAFPAHLQKHLIALYKLDTILQVNNEGWVPDLGDIKQWKYYPWFRINKATDGSSGFGLSYVDAGYGSTLTYLGVRLACQSSDLAEFMGKTFTDLYTDLLS